MNSNVEIQGDFKLSTSASEGFLVDGVLTARNSQALGYQWDLVEASIKASPSHISLSKVRLTDQAGGGTIPELSGTRLQDGRWLLSVPKLDLVGLSLNKIRRTESSRRKPKKVLSLAQMHLSGVEGTLGDRLGWRGEGSVEFAYHTGGTGHCVWPYFYRV